jgi:ankyrin repeat protein
MGILMMYAFLAAAVLTAVVMAAWFGLYAVLARVASVHLPFPLTITGAMLLAVATMRLSPLMSAGLGSGDAEAGRILHSVILVGIVAGALGTWTLSVGVRSIFLAKRLAPVVPTPLGSGKAIGFIAAWAVVFLVTVGIGVAKAREKSAEEGRVAALEDSMSSAAKAGDLAAVRALVGQHPDWDRRYKGLGGSTVMGYALSARNAALVDLLLERPDQLKYVREAAYAGDVAAVEKFLARGASPSGPALVAASEKVHRPVVELLISRGADLTVDAAEVLQGAILARDMDLLTYLLEKGVSPASANRSKITPLMVAAFKDGGPMLEALLSRGAPIDAVDGWSQTALHHAISFVNVEGVRFLLGKGASPNIQNGAGMTPLMMAADKGQVEMAGALLEAKPDLSLRTKDKWSRTALGIAKMRRNDALIELLTKAGAAE